MLGVPADRLLLLRGQLLGFVQDALRHVEHPDVAEERPDAHRVHLDRRQEQRPRRDDRVEGDVARATVRELLARLDRVHDREEEGDRRGARPEPTGVLRPRRLRSQDVPPGDHSALPRLVAVLKIPWGHASAVQPRGPGSRPQSGPRVQQNRTDGVHSSGWRQRAQCPIWVRFSRSAARRIAQKEQEERTAGKRAGVERPTPARAACAPSKERAAGRRAGVRPANARRLRRLGFDALSRQRRAGVRPASGRRA